MRSNTMNLSRFDLPKLQQPLALVISSMQRTLLCAASDFLVDLTPIDAFHNRNASPYIGQALSKMFRAFGSYKELVRKLDAAVIDGLRVETRKIVGSAVNEQLSGHRHNPAK